MPVQTSISFATCQLFHFVRAPMNVTKLQQFKRSIVNPFLSHVSVSQSRCHFCLPLEWSLLRPQLLPLPQIPLTQPQPLPRHSPPHGLVSSLVHLPFQSPVTNEHTRRPLKHQLYNVLISAHLQTKFYHNLFFTSISFNKIIVFDCVGSARSFFFHIAKTANDLRLLN